MKRILPFLLLMCFVAPLRSQSHPFQNTELGDEERIDNLISMMTLEEKVQCFSTRPAVPRLGVAGTRIVEGLHGLALSGPANWAVKGPGESVTTTFPQAIGLAQTWNPELLRQIASLEAEEARYLTQNPDYKSAGLIVLAPNADLGRDIRWGRTEECYGEDPYLVGEMTVAYVKGLQGDDPKYWKTASLMKHFLANSNENGRSFTSSDFDERLFREYYGYGFYKGITEGGSRAFMAAYNKYNGLPCTIHPVLREVTMNEWGQNGIICTDGGAFQQLRTTHRWFNDLDSAAAACIDAGINMFLDRYAENLTGALDKGLVSEGAIDQALRGVFRVLLKLGYLDDSAANPYATIGLKGESKPWDREESRQLARKATVESVVLMKNEARTLPLDIGGIRSIAVIGPRADQVISDWYAGTPPYQVTILDGIRNAVGDGVDILYAASNKADSAVRAAAKADVALVCVGNHPLSYGLGWGQNQVASDGREDVDRQAITLEQEDLVRLVRQANPNTVLVVVSSFPYALNWSSDHVPAILHISQSSQELGNGLADVLFGDVSPAGRLVQTWPASIGDLPPMLDYNIRNGHTYLYAQNEPLFPFGHGLTYTTFEYTALQVDRKTIREGETVQVRFTLKNTGSIDSDEVVQLYASFPGSRVDRPEIALKSFRRVHVPQGGSLEVSLDLDASDLGFWDEKAHRFVLEPGEIRFFVGPSSVEKRLEGSLVAK
ncbi:MAG: glycoside hydrolase family 3 C-terminal domain-containing protein [Bacteroidales bacterium]